MHELPQLPYAYDALEPHIDARTMEIHHSKHHNAYVTNLNKALEGHDDLAAKSLDDLLRGIDSIPEGIRGAVRNHGGGHANHTLFWQIMTPGGPSAPDGALADAMASAFGDLDSLKSGLLSKAGGQFGSGWGWLVVGDSGLETIATANQDSPLMHGKTPILGVDVWEHAYYLNYQNRRPDYLSAWWGLVNWGVVAEKFAAATA